MELKEEGETCFLDLDSLFEAIGGRPNRAQEHDSSFVREDFGQESGVDDKLPSSRLIISLFDSSPRDILHRMRSWSTSASGSRIRVKGVRTADSRGNIQMNTGVEWRFRDLFFLSSLKFQLENLISCNSTKAISVRSLKTKDSPPTLTLTRINYLHLIQLHLQFRIFFAVHSGKMSKRPFVPSVTKVVTFATAH